MQSASVSPGDAAHNSSPAHSCTRCACSHLPMSPTTLLWTLTCTAQWWTESSHMPCIRCCRESFSWENLSKTGSSPKDWVWWETIASTTCNTRNWFHSLAPWWQGSTIKVGTGNTQAGRERQRELNRSGWAKNKVHYDYDTMTLITDNWSLITDQCFDVTSHEILSRSSSKKCCSCETHCCVQTLHWCLSFL